MSERVGMHLTKDLKPHFDEEGGEPEFHHEPKEHERLQGVLDGLRGELAELEATWHPADKQKERRYADEGAKIEQKRRR